MNQLESLNKPGSLVERVDTRMDNLLDEGITHAIKVIEKIREADRLAVIYRHTPESVDIGVMDKETFHSINLKSLLGVADREIEYDHIFAEERGETPFKAGGQQRIADIFGKPVEFMRRHGGMDNNYLNTQTWETFEPR